MQFAPGTGTIQATTLENQFYTLISLIQSIELDPAKNDKTVNAVSGTVDTDTNLFTGTAQIYAQIIRDPANGILKISYPDPYTGVIYSEGSGGDSKANGLITEALAERALLLMVAEREKKRTEAVFALRLTTPTWAFLDVPLNSPIAHNSIFRFNFNIQTITTFTGNGETRSAVEYL